ncbi:response regulator transcription factor [Salinispira pacifica]|uniref:Adenylate cyclase n=1 Tax=Salinispira pacifica TaxID=1307761 RepID=V5WJL0_9SPIO|nr:response regulator [Salinispira pacifica]AHC15958.1 Adenylate cyclase [Salinispira pacifica]
MDILVVDDEPAIVRLFQQRFRREIRAGKLTLHFASDGSEALEIFNSSKAEVVMILSDINMPGMSGLELLEKIREMDDAIPVYMISAYENEEYSRQSTELGANGFIPKPLDFVGLKKLLQLDE